MIYTRVYNFVLKELKKVKVLVLVVIRLAAFALNFLLVLPEGSETERKRGSLCCVGIRFFLSCIMYVQGICSMPFVLCDVFTTD